MPARILVAAVIFLGAAVSAHAQSEYRGTPAQRAACRPDVFRLCAGEIPSVRGITACLRRNLPRLSPACAAVFNEGQR